MNQLVVPILVFCLFFYVRAGKAAEPEWDIRHPFHLTKSLVLGIFLGMLFLAFLQFAYLKFCTANLVDDFDSTTHPQNFDGTSQSRLPMFSGVDRTIIESIPILRFSALQGSKEGLECAVCISKYEESDVLRLLPKCRHAFHMNCIDQWLKAHSTCPLCSLGASRNPSNLELIVEREQEDQVQGSPRFTIGSSSQSNARGKNQESLIQEGESSSENDKKLSHKFKHKMIVSDVVIKNRWSDISPSDLLSLNSKMLSVTSSKSFSSSESNSVGFPIGLSTSKQIEKLKEDLERKIIFEFKFSRISRNDSSSSFPSASYNEPNSAKSRG